MTRDGVYVSINPTAWNFSASELFQLVDYGASRPNGLFTGMRTTLAAKLRLTETILGCVGLADLCARFRALNEGTECRPGLLVDWLRGRGFPQTAELFDDWATLLGLARSGAWLAGCTFAEFSAELVHAHGKRVDGLALRAVGNRLDPDPPHSRAEPRLCGAYACYSQAWSPSHRGQIIRGSLRIQRTAEGFLAATYGERLLGDAMCMEGRVEITARTAHMLLREGASGLPIFMALTVPPGSLSLLGGIMAGPCLVDDPLPTGTRVAAVRVPDETPVEDSNRYIRADARSIIADLRAFSLPIAELEAFGAMLAAFLPPWADQVEDGELGPLRLLLERPAAGATA